MKNAMDNNPPYYYNLEGKSVVYPSLWGRPTPTCWSRSKCSNSRSLLPAKTPRYYVQYGSFPARHTASRHRRPEKTLLGVVAVDPKQNASSVFSADCGTSANQRRAPVGPVLRIEPSASPERHSTQRHRLKNRRRDQTVKSVVNEKAPSQFSPSLDTCIWGISQSLSTVNLPAWINVRLLLLFNATFRLL